ncbi:MAG: GspH/FimT family pseudopilin [Desulfuromonadaceae bacterium]|nr:GspH/FimT family pseudopilin [Desulfuromonadaceae bacterium]MDD2847857.1 GspH/FimT family pseudopilin [Desulfuromonadaceae bacterium]MDD4129598.1 GspH/FimT family pseudopilin [Desulfuromonadaceae bacterium]
MIVGPTKNKGFSLIEMIIAIAIMAIVIGIAAPTFMTWRDNMQFRQAGKELASFIRTARSRAISTNRQQRVELDVANSVYRLRPGDRATLSNWPPSASALPAGTDVSMPSDRIGLAGTNTEIVCNPNGTIDFTPVGGVSARITIFDKQIDAVADLNSQKYRIDLANTGRVSGNRVSSADGVP